MCVCSCWISVAAKLCVYVCVCALWASCAAFLSWTFTKQLLWLLRVGPGWQGSIIPSIHPYYLQQWTPFTHTCVLLGLHQETYMCAYSPIQEKVFLLCKVYINDTYPHYVVCTTTAGELCCYNSCVSPFGLHLHKYALVYMHRTFLGKLTSQTTSFNGERNSLRPKASLSAIFG